MLIQLVIQRCHKRGILAIGGMAAQIPKMMKKQMHA
jgi:malate synthase